VNDPPDLRPLPTLGTLLAGSGSRRLQPGLEICPPWNLMTSMCVGPEVCLFTFGGAFMEVTRV